MRVLDITTTNLHIMQGIAQDYSKLSTLPANIDNILASVIIRYELDCVNPFELLGLQKIGCIKSIVPMDIINDDLNKFLEETGFVPENMDDEVIPQKAISLNSYMMNNMYYEFSSIRKIGPIGMQKYSCTVFLSGSSILNLYGYNFNQVFEMPKDETISLESFIEAKLIAGLMNSTYNIIQNILISKDIYTNAWYFENFYKGRNKKYTLMSIFDSTGNTIRFVDTTPDALRSSISNAKKTDNYSNREWTIEVVCDTPIYMYFFYLFTDFGINLKFHIVNVEDMMIILSKERRSEDIMKNGIEDNVNIIKSISSLYDEWFNNNMDKEKFNLFSRFLFAPANAKIRYTVHLKFYPDIAQDYMKVLTNLFKTQNIKDECPEEVEFVNILNQISNLIISNNLYN